MTQQPQRELAEYTLFMTLEIPANMREEGIRRYIRDQIFREGWSEAFQTTYIHAKAFKVSKSRPHSQAPERKERYTGVCAVQDNCMDYSDFIESIEDELSEDDDPVCPIKCAKRVNPQQDALAEAYEKGMHESSSPKHDAAITRAATLATLNALEVELRKIKYTSFTGVMEIVDKLRKSTTAAQGPLQ